MNGDEDVIPMQAELRTCKAKVKLKGQMASQQDNLLLERQTAMDRTLQENTTLKQEITSVKDDNDSLKKKVRFDNCFALFKGFSDTIVSVTSHDGSLCRMRFSQIEELKSKLHESQELQQSNQQMIQ